MNTLDINREDCDMMNLFASKTLRRMLSVAAIILSGTSAKGQTFITQVPDTLKILAIGNSFSEDALDNHFRDLCREAGKEVIIGNLVIGGCPLSKHWNNARTDAPAYRYRFMDVNGTITYRDGTRFSEVIHNYEWDYVSFQQASAESGIYDTYSPLDSLIRYVQARVPERTIMMWHQTWAYATTSTHQAFPRYESNQQVMYYAIMAASFRTFAHSPRLNIFIPSGTAIQLAREMTGNPNFTRDGYHLHLVTGRYIAACTWFESIFRTPVTDMHYVPDGLTAAKALQLRKAAHMAVTKAPAPRFP